MNNSQISFLLGSKPVSISLGEASSYYPWTTVLTYLRSLNDRKGTKEGCAEGDCGACTVVLAELDDQDKLVYRAYDSCLLFLPMIAGQQLITVEDLGSYSSLHSVQRSMVDKDGSQCGYCTPGFIMSIFALTKQKEEIDNEEIMDALTGNLCRCTGYRSIFEACSHAVSHREKDQFDQHSKEVIGLLKKLKSTQKEIAIESEAFTYYRPLSLDSALRIMSSDQKLSLVSGGTDIGLLVTKKKEELPALLDLGGIESLKSWEMDEEKVVIGAALSLEDIRKRLGKNLPELKKMLDVFGSRQIRNKATLGGNIGTASPIGDTPPILMAYEAVVNVRGQKGDRQVPIREFITGYRSTDLEASELIISVEIPLTHTRKIRSYKISKRKDLDISTVSAGFSVDLDANGLVKDIFLAYGGMAAMTKRASLTEKALVGKEWKSENIEEALERVDQDFTPITDARASLEGRAVMAQNLLLKFFEETRI